MAGVTIGGAVDEAGRPLDEFGPEDKRRSYLRLAELAPSSVRDDWTSVAESFVSGQTPIAKASAVSRGVGLCIMVGCPVRTRTGLKYPDPLSVPDMHVTVTNLADLGLDGRRSTQPEQ